MFEELKLGMLETLSEASSKLALLAPFLRIEDMFSLEAFSLSLLNILKNPLFLFFNCFPPEVIKVSEEF